jgi:hypothetical protein
MIGDTTIILNQETMKAALQKYFTIQNITAVTLNPKGPICKHCEGAL